MRIPAIFAVCSALLSAPSYADSLWTCQTTAIVRTIIPVRTKTRVQQSFEVKLFDDGTALVDNHINATPIPAYHYVRGKKVTLYPDISAATAAVYELNPTISDLVILSNYLQFSMNRRIPNSTRAVVTGHADEQFRLQDGRYVRSIVSGNGRCARIQ